MKSQMRNRRTGRYDYSNLQMMCACGHTLGQHAAENDTGTRECFRGCEGCTNFNPLSRPEQEEWESGAWEFWGDTMHPFLHMSNPRISDEDWNTEMVKGGERLKDFIRQEISKAREEGQRDYAKNLGLACTLQGITVTDLANYDEVVRTIRAAGIREAVEMLEELSAPFISNYNGGSTRMVYYSDLQHVLQELNGEGVNDSKKH